MPGFAVLYRDPNSARVTFGQYLRVIYLTHVNGLKQFLAPFNFIDTVLPTHVGCFHQESAVSLKIGEL